MDVAASYNNIAITYESQGKYVEALELHEKSKVIRIKAFGHDHVDVIRTCNKIAAVYKLQWQHAMLGTEDVESELESSDSGDSPSESRVTDSEGWVTDPEGGVAEASDSEGEDSDAVSVSSGEGQDSGTQRRHLSSVP